MKSITTSTVLRSEMESHVVGLLKDTYSNKRTEVRAQPRKHETGPRIEQNLSIESRDHVYRPIQGLDDFGP